MFDRYIVAFVVVLARTGKSGRGLHVVAMLWLHSCVYNSHFPEGTCVGDGVVGEAEGVDVVGVFVVSGGYSSFVGATVGDLDLTDSSSAICSVPFHTTPLQSVLSLHSLRHCTSLTCCTSYRHPLLLNAAGARYV